MSLTPPKRLFHIPSMSTVMYVDVVDDAREKGYVAISHVWGEQTLYTPENLGVEGGIDWEIPLSSPNKVSTTIKTMADFKKEYCWWDVLCMPQDKQNEINLEIPFMGDYYAGADITLVLSDINYDISGDFIEWYNIVASAMRSQRKLTLDEKRWIELREGRLILLDTSEDMWFRRVWTLQEAVLSKKIILVSNNGDRLDLSDVLVKVSYMISNSWKSLDSLFGESIEDLVNLGGTIKSYKDKTLDVAKILGGNTNRGCYKIHDRFYGMLGILGYKNFVVDYGMNIRELNKKIAQYAYSKGDLGWMSVGGDLGTGFIQPMYMLFSCVGYGWRGELGNGITFEDEALCMKTMTFATVTCCKDFYGSVPEFTGWVVRVFRSWGFDDTVILRAIIGYDTISDRAIQIGVKSLDYYAKGVDLKDIHNKMILLFGKEDTREYYVDIIDKIFLLHKAGTMNTIAKANVSMLNEDYPLMISGNVDIGDKIVVPVMVDFKGRHLGIVVSNAFRRKGVCLIPPIQMAETRKSLCFVPCKFPL